MNLKNRVKKLEQIIQPKIGFHVICAADNEIDAEVEKFKRENPGFTGEILAVTDCYKGLRKHN